MNRANLLIPVKDVARLVPADWKRGKVKVVVKSTTEHSTGVIRPSADQITLEQTDRHRRHTDRTVTLRHLVGSDVLVRPQSALFVTEAGELDPKAYFNALTAFRTGIIKVDTTNVDLKALDREIDTLKRQTEQGRFRRSN